jgi:hypothetical protein
MRHLTFAAPDADAFLAALGPQAEGAAAAPIQLLGDNDLARDIAAAAEQRGIALQRIEAASLGAHASPGTLIFTETDGERLGAELLGCLEMTDVSILAPVTDWHYSSKPLFLVSIPKSGTHLIYELAQALGYHPGVEVPEFPHGQTWYCVEYSNSHTVARDVFVDGVRRAQFGNRHHAFMQSPALFIYRHPLDILVSEAHYYHRDGKAAFAGWLSGLDFAGRVDRLLNDNWLLGSLRERIGGFLPWQDFPNVIPFSFEELVGSAGGGDRDHQLRLVWSIQLKLQAPGSPEAIAASIFNPDSATFRSGQIGGYRKELPKALIKSFAKDNSDILDALGYPPDGSLALPAQRLTRLARRPVYSGVSYEGTAINLESNFLGCNLVRFRGRIYALPMAAGPLAVDALPVNVLSELPSATDLNELKLLLALGPEALEQRKKYIRDLGETLVQYGVEVHADEDISTTDVS